MISWFNNYFINSEILVPEMNYQAMESIYMSEQNVIREVCRDEQNPTLRKGKIERIS